MLTILSSILLSLTAFYHDHSAQQTQVALDALTDYPLTGNEQVLEIGSGCGKVTAYIANRLPNGHITGLDLSEESTDFAKNNYSSLYPNTTFVCQDFLDTTYTETFDLIVSFSTLHWILDHEPLLKKIHSALKPSGSLLFTIPCKPKPQTTALFNELLSRWDFSTYSHPRKKFTPKEYETLLTQTGYTNIDVQMIEKTHHFLNKRELINWFKAFTPLLDQLPPELHTPFLEDFASTYLKTYPPNPQGLIPFIQDELYIKATK